jgi:Fe-S cluster assembly protein SufD
MTVAATKTKAEQALTQSFEAVASRLPGGHAVAAARKAAIGVFSALGLPHRRIEQWKYTDLRVALKEVLPPAAGDETKVTAAEIERALEGLAELDAVRVVFVDGVHRPELSSANAAGAGYDIASLAAALAKSADGSEGALSRATAPGQEAVIALNTAFMTDGAVVCIAEGARPTKPLLLVFATAGKQGRLVTTRNSMQLGAGARATIIEAHVALFGAAQGQTNALSEVSLAGGAELAHVKCTLAGEASTHLGTWVVALGQDARYRAFQLTAATGLTRNGIFALFEGEDAKLDISGAFLGRGSEHIDSTLVVDHAVPCGESRELFKGVLADHARGVFQGKVIVRPNAQKTDGKQMAQALLLSPDAEFDSKPELEIFADDVVCGHGSTSAEIDEDQLFYLLSRGIPRAEARALLIESFIGEALDKVEDERLRQALFEMAKSRLAALTAARG